MDTLVAAGVLQPIDVTRAKAMHFGAEMVDLRDMTLTDEVIAAVPRHVAKKFNVVPVAISEEGTAVAVADPSDLDNIDAIQVALGASIQLRVASQEEIDDALNRYYGGQETSELSEMIQDITEGEVEIGTLGSIDDDDGADVDADAPIIKLVNSLIVEAFKMRASDIHLEPLGKKFRVRYRIDGVLHEMKGPPKRLQLPIISRLKIMSNMSISEKRIRRMDVFNLKLVKRRSIFVLPVCQPIMANRSSCVFWTRKV